MTKKYLLFPLAFLAAACAAPARGPAHTVTGDVSTLSLPGFLGGRRVWVYLPPGYSGSQARYPVLYLLDGQNLFDAATSFAGEWRVDETCERLIRSGELEPVIVVGVDNAGAGRIAEYTPWPDQEHGGGGAGPYLAALKTALKPEIDARYRTKSGAADTFIGGSSLGGLLAAYAGYSDPGTWGGVLAMSPSYWWAGEKYASWAAAQGKPALRVFYQDMGTAEAGADPGVQDYIGQLRRAGAVAMGQGFVAGRDFLSVEAAGDAHNEAAWARRLPGALEFLFGAGGRRGR